MNSSANKKNKLNYLDLLDIPFKKDLNIIHVNDFIPITDTKSKNEKHAIIVSNEIETKLAFELAHINNINHFVNEHRHDFLDQLNFSASVTQNPMIFFSDPAQVILQSHTEKNKKIEYIYRKKFNSAVDKQRTLDEIDMVFDKMNYPSSTKRIARSILDELYTNSIYNAPFITDEGNKSGRSRTDQNIILSENNENEIFIATNSTDVLLGCRDPFGSLNLDYIKNKIYSCYKNGVSKSINFDTTGGAGIGTYLIVESSASYYAGTREGEETLVLTSFPIKMTNRKRSEYPKNYHFINIKKKEKIMSEMSINVTSSGDETKISVSGHIDEDSDFSGSVLTGSKIILDLEKIDAINSCGIREWIKWIKSSPESSTLIYKNCPKIIIDQVNMVAGFLPENGTVESFYVPYYSEESGDEKMILFNKGVEYNGSDIKPPENIKDNDGEEMEMDIIEAKYFKFLKS